METKYFNFNEREWRYKGEGNAHLTLALPKDQLVLRLEKVQQENPVENGVTYSTVELEVEFIITVITKLFGRSFIVSPKVVNLKAGDVENINKLIFFQRPEYRRHKKIGNCTATLWPDLCFLPSIVSTPAVSTFSIEIKPKQGVFAPSDTGTQQCLFCLKQDLKLSQKVVSKKSNYCPLNLYSGDQEKMTAALKGLLHTPQNNFKIYKDGEPIFDDRSSPAVLQMVLSEWLQSISGTCLEERLCAILLDVLTREMAVSEETRDDESGWLNDGPPLLCRLARSVGRYASVDNANEKDQPACYWGPQNLPSGCVLERLSAVQGLGVCGHAAAYELYRQEANLGSDDYGYVKDMIEAGCSSALSPLQCYLVAALARDCSIMIAFQRAQHEKQTTLPVVIDKASGMAYVFQIRLVDLDPKPLSCVKKQQKRNYDIAQAHKQFVKKTSP